MNSILKNIKTNNLIFAIIFLVTCFSPIFFKMLLSPSIGPNFKFYFFFVWIPFISLFISGLRGLFSFSLTSLFIILALLISLINIPLDPLMDFRRQIVYQSSLWIALGAILALISNIILSRVSIEKLRVSK